MLPPWIIERIERERRDREREPDRRSRADLPWASSTSRDAGGAPLAALGRLALALVLAGAWSACGGGSAGGDGTAAPATHAISGAVTRMVNGIAEPSVRVELSGTASAAATTDATGHYRFGGLGNGTYGVTVDLAGQVSTPPVQAVTISGADVAGVDLQLLGGSTLASSIRFLPDMFLSTDQLRASLVVAGDDLLFTDSSDTPVKKLSAGGTYATGLASRFGAAERVVLRGPYAYWVDGDRLNRTSLDGRTTTVLATGRRDLVAGVTADIIVDDADVFWVNTVSSLSCSPSCTWVIQRVPLGGGAPVTLATVSRPVVALASDADNLYWEEGQLEPVSPGCQCGSAVKSVPKAGGAAVLLVDSLLNGPPPPLPPGQVPASWYPTGGLAVTPTQILFAVAGDSYELKTVPISGGSVTTIASVSTSATFSLYAIRDLSVVGTRAYWIDAANGTLDTVPVAGGDVTVLASGLGKPIALATSASTAFWTETGAPSGCCLQEGMGSIRQVSLAGGPAGTLVSGLDAPGAIAVDGANVAWAEAWRVASEPVGGGPVTTIASGVSSDMARIAVDGTRVFILDGDYIKSVQIAGGIVEKLVSAHGGSIGDFSQLNEDIATDGTSVYWTARDIGPGVPYVQKVSVTGGAPIVLTTEPVFAYPQDCYWRIAVDAQNVYWSAGSTTFPVGCAVKKVPIGGGSVTTLVDQPYLRDFAVDATDIFFTDEGTIQKIPIAGGQITLVATDITVWVLANDATRLFWIDPYYATIGGISKAPGTAPTAAFSFPITLAMDPILAAEALVVDQGGLLCTETPAGAIDFFY